MDAYMTACSMLFILMGLFAWFWFIDGGSE